MARVAVFDSGFGSLSIIKPIQKRTKTEIIYFADQKNFPYAAKSVRELRKIIKSTILLLQEKFKPDLIIIGSNTPSILLKGVLKKSKIIGVFPPLRNAVDNTKSKSVAILSTRSIVESKALQIYINKSVPKNINIIKINASPLVDLVESGKFISNANFCKKQIKRILQPLLEINVDVATLSSTHLPFLLSMLRQIYPSITFLDPANAIADQVTRTLNRKRSKNNSMKIFTSGNISCFQQQLRKIGIKNKVRPLSLDL